MAEMGLGRFAQVALGEAQVTVPRYRTCFSKRQFSQLKRRDLAFDDLHLDSTSH
jgi:hypothetical protein